MSHNGIDLFLFSLSLSVSLSLYPYRPLPTQPPLRSQSNRAVEDDNRTSLHDFDGHSPNFYVTDASLSKGPNGICTHHTYSTVRAVSCGW